MDRHSDDIEDRNDSAASSKPEESLYRKWLPELRAAKRRLKDFFEKGEDLCKIYEAVGNEPKKHPYNILYANTETMLPALYSAQPVPVVERRYKDDQPLALRAGTVLCRMLEYHQSNTHPDFAASDVLYRSAVLAALVPGRGIIRFRYEKLGSGSKAYEYVPGKYVEHNRFLTGYAKVWEDVPWIAYIHSMTKDQLKENFPEAMKKTSVNLEAETDDHRADEKDNPKATIDVFEIWDKKTKRVIFLSDSIADKILKDTEDPLELEGFFDTPEPLQFVHHVNSMDPTALYLFYEEQAKELNSVTARLKGLIYAMRVRGAYDSNMQGLARILSADDNEMIGIGGLNTGPDSSTLDKAIWLMPLDKLQATVQVLAAHRESVKSVIFEIMGVADIMRGSTAASETLGAQELKNTWGSMRMKTPQKEVQRFIRDCLGIQAELICNHFEQQSFQKMTGLPYLTQQDKAREQAMFQQQLQSSMLMAQQTAQQPPPPPEPPPSLAEPSWEDLLAVLQDDMRRNYAVRIETNSTIEPDATEDKKDVTEMYTAITQMIQAFGPLVQQGVFGFDMVKDLLMELCRRFRNGADLEMKIQALKPPPPKPDPQVEMQKQEHEQKMGEMKAKHENDQRMADLKFQLEQQKMQMQLQFERERLELERQKMHMELQAGQVKHQQQMEAMAMQAAMPPKEAPAEKKEKKSE